MKRTFNSNNGSNKRVCFSEDTKSDSSFSDDTIPPHHFHLGQDVYAAMTYFASMVQVHLRLYKRDGNNRLFPTKRGVCFSPMLWQSFVNQIEQINTSSSVEETILIKDSLMISTVFIENIPNIIFQRYFQKKDYSKKFVPGTCVLSENNWLELQRIHKIITESVMWLTFDRMLRNLLLSEASKIMPSAVVNTDASEVELVLTTSLIELLCDYLGNSIADVFECYGCVQQYGNQLGHECITMDYETRIRLYGGLALFTIDFEQLIKDFIQRNIQLLNYLNPIFVNKWDMLSIFDNAKKMYIASDPNR
ncbi:PC4 domain-containing protein [Trichonephila clavipes]|nr:PC4 domain-containing protein [Trichonephila clavipes]